MKKGYLSEYFVGVAAKILSAVEVDSGKSNQHEFNGVSNLKKIFGTEKKTFNTTFIYFGDNDDEPVIDEGKLTWYDARKDHPTRTEFRMYFTSSPVLSCTETGDGMFIALRSNDQVLVIVTENKSTIFNQLSWLFGIDDVDHPRFSIREKLETSHDRIAFASRFILDQIGVDVDEEDDTYLEDMLERFGTKFPSTKEFSAYSRSTVRGLSPTDYPDIVLMAWMEREEILFRTLEKHLIAEKLTEGFDGDVDGFIKFSLSVQNRRKSRAGHSLENNVEQLLIAHRISYKRNGITENNSKPDFLFPGIDAYHDKNYDIKGLTMLGVKSTCKDRWRQVLSEAEKIDHKHLLTLEAAISENQTNEMNARSLSLVLPQGLHETYTSKQQKDLLSVNDFILLIQDRSSIYPYELKKEI